MADHPGKYIVNSVEPLASAAGVIADLFAGDPSLEPSCAIEAKSNPKYAHMLDKFGEPSKYKGFDVATIVFRNEIWLPIIHEKIDITGLEKALSVAFPAAGSIADWGKRQADYIAEL